MLTNYYQITLKSNIHHDIDFDEENVDWLFKILVKIMRMANYKCTSSSFSTGKRETELGGFTDYISYFLISSKLEYAEKLLDEFFESALAEETVLPKSVDKYKLINNEINFTNNVSINPVEFSLDDKHRIIKLYDRLFGKNNNLSILLSIILDEFKGDFMCKQENIFEIVSSALGANNSKLDNRKIKVGYFHFLKNNCQANDIFFKLLKIHATDIFDDESNKDFVRELSDNLNLDIDILPIIKSDNCKINLQSNWRSSYNDLSTNEIILGVLLNTTLKDNDDGKYEKEIIKLIERSLDYVTDSKGKPEPFTVFLSEILHSANTTISEKAFTEICHLIINRVLSNKTKKELLFGYNKNIDSTKTKGTSDANYSRNYYSLVFGNYCNFKAKQLFGYDECDIANACLMIVLIGFLTIWGPLIAKLSNKLSHDDKRVRGKTGLLAKATMDSPIKRVGGVSVEQGIIGRVLNYGTVRINVTGDRADYAFPYIDNPNAFKESLLSIMDEQ